MENHSYKKIAFLFPGQGAQYPGIAKDFVNNFSAARLTLEEADKVLNRPISDIILNGPEYLLTQTQNSQVAIYTASIAILRVVEELYELCPFVCTGLSLGEYTALTAGEWLPFMVALPLVQKRGEFMSAACEISQGSMAVVIGIDAHSVQEVVKSLHLPDDLWVANYNCPGQVVISGTARGIEAGTEAVKAKGAKRVIPLQVHGAFHSGLMKSAEESLAPFIEHAHMTKGSTKLVMNVTGTFEEDIQSVKRNLIKQVTHSVRWEQGIRSMEEAGVDLYVEFGPGKTLAGMNKRIGVKAPTLSIEKIEDLDQLSILSKEGKIKCNHNS